MGRLLTVDQHLLAGIDKQLEVPHWFLGTGKGEILALAWDVCVEV